MVGFRETNLVNWGSFATPTTSTRLPPHDRVGQAYITPGVAIGGELIADGPGGDQPDDRILLGSSYFDSWENEPTFLDPGPARQPGRQDHPWNKVTLPRPQKRDFTDKYTWWSSRASMTNAPTPCLLRHRWRAVRAPVVTAKAGLVDFGYAKATVNRSRWCCRARPTCRRWNSSGTCRESTRSSATARAPITRHTAALISLHCLERAMKEVRAAPRAGASPPCRRSRQLRLSRGRPRSALPPHRDPRQKDRQLTSPIRRPVNASPRDSFGPPGPYEDAVQNTPFFEENGRKFKGIDSCAPCAVRSVPAVRGAHVHGRGNVRKVVHTPTAMA